jgi:hypothetical protein
VTLGCRLELGGGPAFRVRALSRAKVRVFSVCSALISAFVLLRVIIDAAITLGLSLPGRRVDS